MLIRIDAPPTERYKLGFVAGVVIKEPHNRCAPIIGYMEDWTVDKILNYCKKRRWKAEIIRERHPR